MAAPPAQWLFPHGNSALPNDFTAFYAPDVNVAEYNLPPMCAHFENPPKSDRREQHILMTTGAHGNSSLSNKPLADGPIPSHLSTDIDAAYLFVLECRGFSWWEIAGRMDRNALAQVSHGNLTERSATNLLSMRVQRWKLRMGILGDLRVDVAKYNPIADDKDSNVVARLTPLQILFNTYWTIHWSSFTMSQPEPPVRQRAHVPPANWQAPHHQLPIPPPVSARVKKVLNVLRFPIPIFQQYPALQTYLQWRNTPGAALPVNLPPLPQELFVPIGAQLAAMGLSVPPHIPVPNPRRQRLATSASASSAAASSITTQPDPAAGAASVEPQPHGSRPMVALGPPSFPPAAATVAPAALHHLLGAPPQPNPYQLLPVQSAGLAPSHQAQQLVPDGDEIGDDIANQYFHDEFSQTTWDAVVGQGACNEVSFQNR